MMMAPIMEFKGEYRFLSNFYDSPFVYNKILFKTNEYWYQAHKSRTRDEFMYIVDATTPGLAKKRGSRVQLIDMWDITKEGIMYVGLQHKFHYNPQLKQMLFNTAPRELIEGNWWGDKYWGKCLKTNEGQNRLGFLLMTLRNQLMKEALNAAT